MNFLKNKLTALILVVVLIGLLGGCDGQPFFVFTLKDIIGLIVLGLILLLFLFAYGLLVIDWIWRKIKKVWNKIFGKQSA
jgi:hypothetical protein